MSKVKPQTSQNKKFWDDGAGFFGRGYMEGDNSVEGFLSTSMGLQMRTDREVEGVIKLLNLETGERILDCPCGYGRHSIALARRGFKVVGSDINSEMLAPALQTSEGMDNIRFVKENMQDLTYLEEFDAVTNLFFSFGFFETEEENNDVLRRFFNALKPGGKFLMHTDVNVPHLESTHYKFHETRNLITGKRLEINERYDSVNQRLYGQWTLISPEGIREELTPYNHIIYTYESFAKICRAAGFINIKGYGAWDGTLVRDDSEEMMVLAEKPA
jgi:cyclopropane fatty-acyl-phospholipid synthase-like methyltransferase